MTPNIGRRHLRVLCWSHMQWKPSKNILVLLWDPDWEKWLSDSFSCSWTSFSTVGLSCSTLMWSFFCLMMYYVVTFCYFLEACYFLFVLFIACLFLFFFFILYQNQSFSSLFCSKFLTQFPPLSSSSPLFLWSCSSVSLESQQAIVYQDAAKLGISCSIKLGWVNQ